MYNIIIIIAGNKYYIYNDRARYLTSKLTEIDKHKVLKMIKSGGCLLWVVSNLGIDYSMFKIATKSGCRCFNILRLKEDTANISIHIRRYIGIERYYVEKLEEHSLRIYVNMLDRDTKVGINRSDEHSNEIFNNIYRSIDMLMQYNDINSILYTASVHTNKIIVHTPTIICNLTSIKEIMEEHGYTKVRVDMKDISRDDIFWNNLYSKVEVYRRT